jgi:3-phenylpropionate/trans-cinnamate dioxygenase ferredoxin subunit
MVRYNKVDESKVDFLEVGPANLKNAERVYVKLGEKLVTVFNIAGDYYAIDDVCTHDGWSLYEGEISDHQVICPRHHARFDVRTGKVIENPPDAEIAPISTYPIKIEKGILYVGMPKES